MMPLVSAILTALVFIGSVVPTPSSDDMVRWGWDGHKIVCLIAWWELDDSAREGVRDLLADDNEFERFMESCLWADQVRGRDEAYDRYTTAHYVNLPPDAQSFDLERDCAANLCAVEAIEEARATLEDRTASRAARLDALKFLSHFVGDIHQPMHAGYAHDRGGNDTRITAFGEPSNVHRVWDYILIDQTGKPWVDYASSLWFDISDADRESWRDPNPAHWAEESYRIMRETAYAFSPGDTVDRAYYDRTIGIVEQRMQIAGIRLAQTLNALFAD